MVRPTVLRFTIAILMLAVSACSATPRSGATSTNPAAPAPTTAPGAGAATLAPVRPGVSFGQQPQASVGQQPGSSGKLSDATVLVEPIPEVIAWQSSVTFDRDGAPHLLILDSSNVLTTLDCRADCASASSWSRTVLNPGLYMQYPQLRTAPDGSLVGIVDDETAGEAGDYLTACGASCDQAASWGWAGVQLPDRGIMGRSSSRYFAIGGDSMIIGLGISAPMSALVCAKRCEDSQSWHELTFSDWGCSAPSVAALPSGGMAIACATYDYNVTQDSNVQVFTCPGSCTKQGSWSEGLSLAVGGNAKADVTLAPDGTVGVALNVGTMGGTVPDWALGYYACAHDCGKPTSWASTLIGDETLFKDPVAITTDEAGRTVIAFTGEDGDGIGIHAATCEGSCTDGGNWKLGLLDTSDRVAAELPISPPAGCTYASWIPQEIDDVAAHGGRFAVAYSYGAIGTGGSCANGIFNPYADVSTFYSVVAVAIAPF